MALFHLGDLDHLYDYSSDLFSRFFSFRSYYLSYFFHWRSNLFSYLLYRGQ